MAYTLPHHANEHHRSINTLRSCVFGSDHIGRIYELISKLLTAFIGKNSIVKGNNKDSKIIEIAIF